MVVHYATQVCAGRRKCTESELAQLTYITMYINALSFRCPPERLAFTWRAGSEVRAVQRKRVRSESSWDVKTCVRITGKGWRVPLFSFFALRQ
jgi:hypothetical protein